ncbi:MAG TPA: prephenate dehydrogenase/arogenate dehydrogenase family protein [Bryobacteraceae bacterium]|nr:prephenate dehydrogenase/arogenate dehydrogenase family protein [Bryobacteraceae bacterium]
METVAIFGVGLIGGSFALALRKAGFSGRIIGVSSDETIRAAMSLGVIDAALPAKDAAAQADLIYLAQPISKILDSLADLDSWVKPQTLITDAGSTKQAIVQRAGQVISRAQFLGGHPMAGRERRGVEAAEADLFEGRPYVLTPGAPAQLETPVARELLAWIPRIGSFPVIMSAEEHDRTVAFTSHLPQLGSTALAALLDGRREAQSGVYGPALVDSTRLALSSFDIWGDIFDTNRAQIVVALESYIDQLQAFRAALDRPVVERELMRRHFDAAARLARNLRAPAELHTDS